MRPLCTVQPVWGENQATQKKTVRKELISVFSEVTGMLLVCTFLTWCISKVCQFSLSRKPSVVPFGWNMLLCFFHSSFETAHLHFALVNYRALFLSSC